jgi:coenzyme F420-reducing hydrogenase beta subunit
MHEYELGHVYPCVSSKDCINCGKCLKVCHAVKVLVQSESESSVYAVQAHNREILADSSSGGVFSLLAKYVLSKGGVVYGSKWVRGKGAAHVRVDSYEELSELRRSKYVFSQMTDTFKCVQNDLDAGLIVLFVGTPCQIAAIKTYLGNLNGHLFTADLICHGVPSAKLFEDYLVWFEQDKRCSVYEYNSRDKLIAGWSYRGSYKTSQSNIGILPVDDPYTTLFNLGITFRSSCYACNYSNSQRVADLTLGDFWGVEKLHLNIDQKYGVSVVLVNSAKGTELFAKAIKNNAYAYEVSFDDAARQNTNLLRSTQMPSSRMRFSEAYASGDFENVVRLTKKLYWKEILLNRVKSAIPPSIKLLIKRVF